MKLLLALLAAVALSGCAAVGGAVVNADLDGATALATGAGDAEAVTCFEKMKLANTTGIVGMFGLIEQVRIFKMIALPACAKVLAP